MNIFIGNLSFQATEHDILRLFRKFGDVLTITIVMDKNGVKSRGFGFVEMPDDEKARAAIAGLDGAEFMGRNLNVSPARPKTPEGQERPQRREFPRPQASEHRGPQGSSFPQRPSFPQRSSGNERPSRFKGGRRSTSYLKRIGAPIPPRPQEQQRFQRRDPRQWKKEEEAGGEVVQVRRNLKPWEKRKSFAPAAATAQRADKGRKWRKTRTGPKSAAPFKRRERKR